MRCRDVTADDVTAWQKDTQTNRHPTFCSRAGVQRVIARKLCMPREIIDTNFLPPKHFSIQPLLLELGAPQILAKMRYVRWDLRHLWGTISNTLHRLRWKFAGPCGPSASTALPRFNGISARGQKPQNRLLSNYNTTRLRASQVILVVTKKQRSCWQCNTAELRQSGIVQFNNMEQDALKDVTIYLADLELISRCNQFEKKNIAEFWWTFIYGAADDTKQQTSKALEY